jgi:hypothetical protein
MLSIVLNGPCILHKRCCQSLGMGHISVLAMALNRPSFLWIQLPNTSAGSYVLPLKMVSIVLNGPSILFVSCCRFLEICHVYRSEYTGQSLKRPTFLLRKLPNTSTGPPIVLSNILLIELNGPRGALLLDAQCSRLGPAYCMRGAANFLELATLLIDSILSMTLKQPTFFLRKINWTYCR